MGMCASREVGGGAARGGKKPNQRSIQLAGKAPTFADEMEVEKTSGFSRTTTQAHSSSSVSFRLSASAPLAATMATTSTVIEFNLSGLHEKHTVRANVPPPLSELCVRVLAANFSTRPTLRGIAPRYINRMTELLPTSLPLEVTGPLIDDEGYWKRCATARWDNCEIAAHGSSWKRTYFERNLADFLEEFDPLKQDTEDLTRMLAVSKDYIFSLRIKQVCAFALRPSPPAVDIAFLSCSFLSVLTLLTSSSSLFRRRLQFLSHLDMEMLFQNVPTLCNLEMTFGVKEVGMEYERSLFGMKMSDVTSLQNALRVTETLTILSLPCNLLDDNTMRILASGLQSNSTITALDLSHNKIADRGVKAIAKLLDAKCVLISLNLCDNHIHADGGKYFGRALKMNSSLETLNLRLNRLGDEGGKMLLDGLNDNTTLTHLNLSCNALDHDSAQQLSVILSGQSPLQSLDLSCNVLSEEAGRLLRDGLQSNTMLTHLDLRLNQVSVDTAAAVDEICKTNKSEAQRTRRAMFEAQRAAVYGM